MIYFTRKAQVHQVPVDLWSYTEFVFFFKCSKGPFKSCTRRPIYVRASVIASVTSGEHIGQNNNDKFKYYRSSNTTSTHYTMLMMMMMMRGLWYFDRGSSGRRTDRLDARTSLATNARRRRACAEQTRCVMAIEYIIIRRTRWFAYRIRTGCVSLHVVVRA